MLQTHTDAFFLGRLDKGRAKRSRNERVFAVIFKISSAERTSFDVDPGAKDDLYPRRFPLFGHSFCHLRSQSFVKAASEGTLRGKTGGGNTLVFSHEILSSHLFAQAVRAVRQLDGRDAKPLHRLGAKGGFSGA